MILTKQTIRSESPQAFMQNGTIWSIIVFSLSTAQLTSSIASSLAALHLRDSISAYHYNIVCYLGIAAVFTSSASMLVPFAHTYKSWSSIIRLTLLLMLIILLGILLSPRFTHYKVFPGRAPLDHASNDTALVFQVSCLLEMRDALVSTRKEEKYRMCVDFALRTLLIVLSPTTENLSGWYQTY